MPRFTISLDDTLAKQFDALITTSGCVNCFEAVLDLVRTRLGNAHLEAAKAPWCVAALNDVYDHPAKTVSERVLSLQPNHHDMVVRLRTHLDHDDYMKTVVLQGPTPAVAAFAQLLIALRGVRHGNVHIVPLGQNGHKHTHTQPHSPGEGKTHRPSRVRFKPTG